MKTPELSVEWSPSVATDLLLSGSNPRSLVPRPDDLPPLTERLGLEPPDTLAAVLLRREEQPLYREPRFSTRPNPENAGEVLHVYVGEISEQNILEGFAHSLVAQAQLKHRMNVLKGGAAAMMVEVGVGSTIQQMGSYWGLLGIPLAVTTMGGLWLWHRGWHNAQQVVPNLDGLRSPVGIVIQE